MISAILKILAVIAKIGGWFFDRKVSPSHQYEEAKSENAKAVTSGDEDFVNRSLDRNIDRLSDNQPGSGNPI